MSDEIVAVADIQVNASAVLIAYIVGDDIVVGAPQKYPIEGILVAEIVLKGVVVRRSQIDTKVVLFVRIPSAAIVFDGAEVGFL